MRARCLAAEGRHEEGGGHREVHISQSSSAARADPVNPPSKTVAQEGR